MQRTLGALLAALCVQAIACADDVASRMERLERQNRKLARRVRQLETATLVEDVEKYLEAHEARGASGSTDLLPGGMAIRVSGEIRIREEVKDRVYSPGDPAGARSFELTRMRTRLRFDVDVLEDLGVVIELQDIRVWGDEGSTTGDSEGVDLKRAMIVFRDVGGAPLTVEAGRFVMAYGDQRLIGHLEWFDQGRTYDGLRALYHPEDWWVDGFFVRVRETVTPADDQWFAGVYGGRGPVEAYALLFADDRAAAGEAGLDDTMFTTLGFRVHDRRGAFDYTVEVAFQAGDVNGDDLSAFGLVVEGGFTFEDAPGKPRVALLAAYATGDDDPADGDQGTFQTLFPTNHLHYGRVDVLGWGNLLDLAATVKASPSRSLTLLLEFHYFRVAEEEGPWIHAGGGVIRTGAPGAGEELGSEIDFTVIWKPNARLSFLFQYGVFFPGDFVERTGDDATAQALYVQGRVKF